MDTGYTVSFQNLKKYPTLKTVQYTLNPYLIPPARKTFETLQNHTPGQNIIVHAEFYHSLARVPFLNKFYKGNLVFEIASTLRASVENKNVVGFVLHTDCPFSKDAIAHLVSEGIPDTLEHLSDFFDEFVNSKMFLSSGELVDRLGDIFLMSDSLENLLINLYTLAVAELSSSIITLMSKLDIESFPARVYLENNTRFPILGKPYSVEFVSDLVRTHPGIFGLCFDEEHAYASGDITLFDYETGEFRIPHVLEGVPLLVHLNTIPPEVSFGSRKDRHSLTSIYDSKVASASYIKAMEFFTRNSIPFVREVKESVIDVELPKLLNYKLDPWRNFELNLPDKKPLQENTEVLYTLSKDETRKLD